MTVDAAELGSRIDDLVTMSDDERSAELAAMGVALQLDLAVLSGLADELGGPEAAATALQSAWQPTVAGVLALEQTPIQGFRSAPGASFDTSEGLFAGYMALALLGRGLISSTNGRTDAEMKELSGPGKGNPRTDLRSERAKVGSTTTGEHTSNGVTTKLVTSFDVVLCPDKDGKFDGKATVDVTVSKGAASQRTTIDVTMTGALSDDAKLAELAIDYRAQAGRSSGGRGEFIDLSGAATFGSTPSGVTVNRSGGTVSDALRSEAQLTGNMYALLAGIELIRMSEEGWASGRCVQLNASATPGPTGLEPSATSTITAEPRSKIDGGPTGGKVTSTLSAGGVSVDPAGTPVSADATFTYLAPDEPKAGGTVDLESRSRRGIAKASITFDTAAPASYQIVGGLEDFQVNEAVCDINAPFTLTSGVGTMQLSGGLSGTYEFSGIFDSHYTGAYEITLPDGPGQPGTMTGFGSGTVAGQAGSGTENYTLTPIEPCS